MKVVEILLLFEVDLGYLKGVFRESHVNYFVPVERF